MCGIAGFWGELARLPDSKVLLERMTSQLAHRGPDGCGYWSGPDVGLGQTRLAIIDVDGGEQPMWDVQRRWVIVFNGEIYNYRSLRSDLEKRGYQFRTRCDTEVIPAVIDAWGIDDGLRRLNGMFAFALYNLQTHRLLLARDRAGIKPLYLATTGQGLLFASEQKALLASDLLSRRVNLEALHDYLGQGYPTTPATCWQDIQLMAPGTWLEIGPAGQRTGRYQAWNPAEDSGLTLEQAVEQLQHTLGDAVQSHLMSDVPVAAFLSGGLDSSLIVALLGQTGIEAFNMGFEDADYDERQAARLVAGHCGIRLHEVVMANQSGDFDLLRRILEQYDEPFGDSSCLPTYLICQEIRQHVRVVLSGDGGDEILGGYARYRYARWLAKLSNFRPLAGLLNPLAALAERYAGRRAAQILKAWRFAQLPRAAMLCSLLEYFSETERLNFYQPEVAEKMLPVGPTAQRIAPFITGSDEPAQQMIVADIRLRLHADYLRKVDIASSAHGLEVRVPFLDNGMLDLAQRLPVRLKIASEASSKPVARALARRLLPPPISRQPKRGFSLPLDRWLGEPLRGMLKDLLCGRDAHLTAFIRPEAVQHIWNAFDDPRRSPGLSRYQRSQRLFLLLSLELWLRRWNPVLA